VTASLAIGAVILLAMICVSWYGWITLPGDARVPIHFGVSYNNFVPKRPGLIVHPGAGVLVYVIFSVASRSAANSSKSPLYAILPIVLGVLLIVQLGAIRVARRNTGTGA